MKRQKYLQKLVADLVKAGFKDGKVVESQVTKSIKILKMLPQYEAIGAMSDYLSSLKRQMRQHTMYIETVVPLSASQLQKIKKMVDKKVKITKVVTSINEEILGGFRLRVGDEIWDDSISSKIVQVREAITNG